MIKTKTYRLSEYGRAVTWQTWKALDGCGLPVATAAYQKLGAVSRWPPELTLGQIEDACPMSGRSLARFAVAHLRMPDLATTIGEGETPHGARKG